MKLADILARKEGVYKIVTPSAVPETLAHSIWDGVEIIRTGYAIRFVDPKGTGFKPGEYVPLSASVVNSTWALVSYE